MEALSGNKYAWVIPAAFLALLLRKGGKQTQDQDQVYQFRVLPSGCSRISQDIDSVH